MPTLLRALVQACLIVALTYPSAVFFGGSVAASNRMPTFDPTIDRTSVAPWLEFTDREGVADLGAPAWQLEPTIRFTANALRQGDTIWWDPYTATGSVGPERLVNGGLAPFTFLVAAAGGGPTAYTLIVLLWLAVGVTALQLLIRTEMGLSWSAALGGAIAFATAGFTTAYLATQMGLPFLQLPLVALTLIRAQHVPSSGRWFAATLVYGSTILIGFVPTIIPTLIVAHAWAFACRQDPTTRWTVVVRRHVGVAAGAAGVAAVLLIPALVHLTRSADLAAYGKRVPGSKSLLEYLTLLTPWHLWDATSKASFPRRMQWTTWIGLVPLFVATLAAPGPPGTVRSRLRRMSFVMLAVGVLLHVGSPIVRVIITLPVLRAVRPAYWAVFFSASATLLVALGVQTIAEGNTTWRRGQVIGALAGLALAVGWLIHGASLGPAWHMLWAATLLATLLAFPLLARRSTPHTTVVLAVALLAIEGTAYINHQLPPRLDVLTDPPSYVKFLRSADIQRVANIGSKALFPDWGSAVGIRQIGTTSIGQLPWYRDLYHERIQTSALFLHMRGAVSEEELDAGALDVMGVDAIVVDAQLRAVVELLRSRGYPIMFEDARARVLVFANPTAFARVRLAATVRRGDVLSSHSHVVHTLDQTLIGSIPSEDKPGDAGRATITRETHDRIIVDVRATRPSVLVVADAWHPEWRAEIDGRTAHIARVERAFRGVRVPEGRHTVTFWYQPRSVRWGFTVTLAVLLIGTILVVWETLRVRVGRSS